MVLDNVTDGGFLEFAVTVGQFVTVWRDGPSPDGVNSMNLYEIRVYQTPNLMK